jgi:acyl-CoA reductase-like NAD-dependent aldehyde dehydrogenase
MATIEVRSPWDDAVVGSVTSASAAEVAAAVATAAEGFAACAMTAIDRQELLLRVRDALVADGESLAQLVCRETGKTIRESRVEVDRAAATLMCAAGEAVRIDGIVQAADVTPQRLDRVAYVHRVPVGTVAAVTPFNFPLNIPAHKIGPALAAGNAVILKPSPKAPLATARFVALFHEAGLDPRLLHVLHGGADVVEALACADVEIVSFTGSTAVGNQIAAWAGGKKVLMELGGNDPIAVMPDADLDAATAAITAHRFGTSGQRCTSCKRAFLHADIYAEMRDRLVTAAGELAVGDPADPATDVGPLIDSAAAEHAMAKLAAAVEAGGQILIGGTRDGATVAPTVVEGVPLSAALCYEETFAPILPLFSFADLDDLVQQVNGQPYGLQAGLFTEHMPTIRDAFRRFDVGALVINEGPGLRVEPIPFGGVKASGIGREGLRYAIEEMTHLKTLLL